MKNVRKPLRKTTEEITALKLQVRELKASLKTALAESEKRFREIIDGAADGIVVADTRSARLISANMSFCNMLGYSEEEVKKLNVFDIHPEESRSFVLEEFKKHCERLIFLSSDIPVMRKDCSIFYADISSFRISFPEKDYLAAFFRDISERKKAETEHQKCLLFIENSSDLIGMATLKGEWIYMNSAFRKALGLDLPVDSGKQAIYDITYTEDHKRIKKEILPSVRNKGGWKGEIRLKNIITNEPVSVETNLFLIKDPVSEKPVAMGSISRDISERKCNECRFELQHKIISFLSESGEICETIHKIFRAAASSLGFELCEFWRIDSNIKAMRLCCMWGETSLDFREFKIISRKTIFLRGEGVPGMTWQKGAHIWVSDLRSYSKFKRLSIASKAGLKSAFAFPVGSQKRILGAIVFYSTNNRPPDKQLMRMFGSLGVQIGDFIERKDVENALFKSEKRFRDVADNVGEWIGEIDSNGKIIYSSQAVKNILGYEPHEVIGKHFYELFHPEDFSDLKKTSLSIIRKRKSFHNFVSRNVHKNGTSVWISTNGIPMFDRRGVLKGYLGAITDITKHRLAEIEKEKLIYDLKDALNKVKTLSGMLPICASCKKIRDDKGYWREIEAYLSNRTDAEFSHGICPECAARLYPEHYKPKPAETNEKKTSRLPKQ